MPALPVHSSRGSKPSPTKPSLPFQPVYAPYLLDEWELRPSTRVNLSTCRSQYFMCTALTPFVRTVPRACGWKSKSRETDLKWISFAPALDEDQEPRLATPICSTCRPRVQCIQKCGLELPKNLHLKSKGWLCIPRESRFKVKVEF